MKFLFVLLSLFVAVPLAVIGWLVAFFGLDQSFWVSSSIALGTGVVLSVGLQGYFTYAFLKKHRLTLKEYIYIRKNLKEAKGKIRRLQIAMMKGRSIRTFRQLLTINRLAKRIYTIVKKEPKRFYQAEQFFYYHLDSVVELTEKQIFLSQQATGNEKMYRSLQETGRTIEALIQALEKDLSDLLSTDMHQLALELDVAKLSLNRQLLVDDGRSTRK